MLVGLNLEHRDLCLNPTTIARIPQLEPLTKSKPQAPNPDPQPKAPRVTFCNLADYAERSTPQPIELEAYTKAGWRDVEFKGRCCIAIPLADGGTKHRNLEADGSKYLNPTGEGKGRGWYGLNRAARLATNGIGIHANGEASAVVAQFFGLPAFASMAGESTPPTPEMLDKVRAAGFHHIIFAPDADEPGRKGATRTAETYRQAGFTVTVRDFGPDQAKGFDLRDFCSIHREHSFEKLTDLAEIPEPKAEPESKPEVRRWFGSDQARFAHAYLSQLGLSARSKNTILLILALLNGHTTGKISNFVLGYFSGRIESGDFDNLELDALHPDHSDSKKKIADRGSKLWKALNRDQERMGVELIQRISGGQNNGERESSTYIVVFGDEMNRIIEEIRVKKLPFKSASTELNRRARALADSQFTARAKVGLEADLPEKIIKEESELEKIERKTVEYLKFIERRKAMGLIDEATAYAILGSVAMATVGQAKAQVVLGALAMATQDPEPTEVETCDELTPYSKEEDTFLSEIEERVLVGIQTESDLPSDENDDWEPPVQAEKSVFWVVNLSTQTENEIIDSGGLNPDEFSGNAVNSDPLTTLENELELPPSTFQNELKFICEEPKETQRAFAHERYQKLRDHLEKCAPNFGFSDLRQKFRSIFGGAICDLLEKTNVPGSVEFLESS
ncbi:MAG TPA: toprim domain-containing protein [Acidobacteriota bacterium]|nr:toprim domain-containing protein [Acidobacteriota bacterium]